MSEELFTVRPTQQVDAVNTLGWKASLLYISLLCPTLLLSFYCIKTGNNFASLFEETWQFPSLQGGDLSSQGLRIVGDLLILGITGAVAWGYWQGYQALQSESRDTATKLIPKILLWAGLFSLVLLWVAPFHSRDLYGYINRGVQQAFYHTNPYTTPIGQIPGWQHDPMLHAHWIDNPSPYGFFFTALTGFFLELSGRSFAVAFTLFKSLNLLLYGLTGWLLYRFSLQLQLERPWLGVYLYAWSPLMLLHTMANGHNDILLAFTLLLSLYTLTFPRWSWLALPLLTLSILTKYAALLAGPFIVLYFIRQRDWKGLLLGSAVSLGIAEILARPYMGGFTLSALMSMAENAGMSQHSLHSMLYRIGFYTAKLFPALQPLLEPARAFLKTLLWGSFGVFYLASLIQFWQKPLQGLFQSLIYQVILTLVVLIVLVSSKFHVWYIGMFFPLLFLLPEESRLRRFGMVLSLVQLLAFTPLENLHVFNYLLLTLLPLWWVYSTKHVTPSAAEGSPEAKGSRSLGSTTE